MSFQEVAWYMLALSSISEQAIQKAVTTILDTVADGGRIFTCGNGGSGNVAEHLVSDIVKGAGCCLPVLVNGQSLNGNQVILSALGNDMGFEYIFSEQMLLYKPEAKDLLIIFSVSGTSPNIIRAIDVAKKCGMMIIAFVGSQNLSEIYPGYTDLQIIKVQLPIDEDITREMAYGIIEGVFSCLAHVIPVRTRHIINYEETHKV